MIFVTFAFIAASEYECDILTNPKDDCGYVCGKINDETKDSNCGNADKRKESLLLVHDPKDKKEENDEYYEVKYFECVEACPQNYQKYEPLKFCVKNSVEFEEFKKGCDSESSNLWVIILSVLGVAIAGIGAGFAYCRKKVVGNYDQNSPEIRASEVGLTKNNSV
ncbi:unnamed protein product [Chironomus riparius]|uniref:Uncharacterized protein n=1 Tax=Chironomus riparius TaxID=315576 RepID=A0A9N9S582_9DIPT|nr:unnamed protein product [Chironomus riparius]